MSVATTISWVGNLVQDGVIKNNFNKTYFIVLIYLSFQTNTICPNIRKRHPELSYSWTGRGPFTPYVANNSITHQVNVLYLHPFCLSCVPEMGEGRSRGSGHIMAIFDPDL